MRALNKTLFLSINNYQSTASICSFSWLMYVCEDLLCLCRSRSVSLLILHSCDFTRFSVFALFIFKSVFINNFFGKPQNLAVGKKTCFFHEWHGPYTAIFLRLPFIHMIFYFNGSSSLFLSLNFLPLDRILKILGSSSRTG